MGDGNEQIGPREFHAGNRVALAPYKRGISDGTQFLDPWRNPYMVRGVPREQAEMSRPLNEVRLTGTPHKKKMFHVYSDPFITNSIATTLFGGDMPRFLEFSL